jgi:hypothetical protein
MLGADGSRIHDAEALQAILEKEVPKLPYLAYLLSVWWGAHKPGAPFPAQRLDVVAAEAARNLTSRPCYYLYSASEACEAAREQGMAGRVGAAGVSEATGKAYAARAPGASEKDVAGSCNIFCGSQGKILHGRAISPDAADLERRRRHED